MLTPHLAFWVFRDGALVDYGMFLTPATAPLLDPETTYLCTVQARDSGDNWSPLSSPVTTTTEPSSPDDNTPPTTPANLSDWGGSTSGCEAWMIWDASTDDLDPPDAIRYDVYVNGALIHSQSLGYITNVVYGNADGPSTFEVVAVDAAGNASAPASITFNLSFCNQRRRASSDRRARPGGGASRAPSPPKRAPGILALDALTVGAGARRPSHRPPGEVACPPIAVQIMAPRPAVQPSRQAAGDGQPADGRSDMSNAFNARFLSTFSLDRLYRVYFERGEIFFIKVGGQSGVAIGVTSQFGVLGAMALRAIKKRGAEKLAARTSELDKQHPSAQLSAHKHNFQTPTTAIQRSSLEPAATLGTHGEHFGRWRLALREGKEMLFQLETLDDMTIASQVLPTLGDVHISNVTWDTAKKKFAKGVA